MSTDFQRLSQDEQKIAKLIASRLWVPVADVASAIISTERCTKLVEVPGLTLQICEALHELMKTSQEAGVTGVNPPGDRSRHGLGLH